MASGDLERFRADLGKGEGFAARAADLARDLDPEGWLVAVGAIDREHNLVDAAAAMRPGDDSALREALGFGDQALRRDILLGGHSIEQKHANGQMYFEKRAQAIDLMDGAALPDLPAGALALHATLFGRISGREYRLTYGHNRHGVTDLQAVRELGFTRPPRPEGAAAFTDPGLARPRTAEWNGLDLSALRDNRWYAARLKLLLDNGTLLSCELGREDAWFLTGSARTTMAERLGDERDARLMRLHGNVKMMARSLGRHPRGPHELSLQAWEYTDPAAPGARKGWARYDADPPRHLRIAEDPDAEGVTCYSSHRTEQGRRAVTRDGTLTWKPARE